MSPEDERSVLQQLRMALPEYTGARRRVAELILSDPVAAARMTITNLAEGADTTSSTVSRMATSLGFDGFQAFRAALALDSGRGVQAGWEQDIGVEIGPHDTPEQILGVLTRDQFMAMRETATALDFVVLERLAEAVAHARRVHIFGEWGDGIPALELHIRLHRIGVASWHYDGAQESRISSNLLGEGDVAIAFTRTGDDPVAEAFLRLAKRRGATVGLITGARDTPIAKVADVLVFTGVGVTQEWTAYFAGRASDSLAASLLWVLVAQRYPKALDAMQGDRLVANELRLVVREQKTS